MKDNILILLLAILIGLITYSLVINNKIKTNVQGYYNKIDSIQNKIDSVTLINIELDSKISRADSNISLINEQINVVDENINVIKKQTNDKISSVDTFNISQLKKFFTERYK